MEGSLCIFCLRNCETNSNLLKENNENKSLTIFLKLLRRYINSAEDASIPEINGMNSLGSCQDCLFLLQEFHNFYCEMELLKMKLNWRIDMLVAIMKSAEKVSSRIQNLNKKFGEDQEMLKNLQDFRNELVREISGKLKTIFPKVKIKRIKPASLDIPQNENSSFVSVPNLKSEMKGVNDHSLEISEPFLQKLEPEPVNETPDTFPTKDEFELELLQSSLGEVLHGFSEDKENTTEDVDHLTLELQQQSTLVTDQTNVTILQEDENLNGNVQDISPALDASESIPIVSPSQRSRLDERNASTDAIDGSDNNVILLQQIQETHMSMSVDADAISHEEVDENISSEFKDLTNETEENDSDWVPGSLGSLNSECDKDDRIKPNLSSVPVDSLKEAPNKFRDTKEAEELKVETTSNTIPVLRRSKRKTKPVARLDFDDDVIETHAPAKISKCDKPNQSSVNASDSTLPTLHELALKKLMSLKYACNIFPCNLTTFWNVNDLQCHLKHHGELQCNFCDHVVAYAPDLWKHEYENHVCKSDENITGNDVKCLRCNFQATIPSVKNHFVKSHLNLTPDRHTCSICQMTLGHLFQTWLPISVARHYQSQHGNVHKAKIVYCDVENCRAFFRTEEQLNQHKITIHGGNLSLCNEDEKDKKLKPKAKFRKSNNSRNLSGQRKSHFRQCPKCKKPVRATNFAEHLKKHKRREHHWFFDVPLRPDVTDLFKNQIFCKQSKCKYYYYKEEDLVAHSRLHGEFKCKFCDLVFDYAGKLAIHEITHNEPIQESEDNFVCSRCPFSTKKINRRHFISHFIESHLCMSMDYQCCPICNAKFYSIPRKFNNYLQQHLSGNHDFTKKIYECKEDGCIAYFNTKQQLDRHENYHKYNVIITPEGKRIWECKINGCGRRLNLRSSYNHHYDRHHRESRDLNKDEELRKDEDKEKAMCNECGKILRNKVGLTSHLFNAHPKSTQQKQPRQMYVCHECGKICKNNRMLKIHSLSHSGPESWEFECPTCAKRCVSKQKLNEHLRTHSKEKPFSCEHCGVLYAHAHNLRIHIKNKHGDNPGTSDLNKRKKRVQLRKPFSQGGATIGKNKLPQRRSRKKQISSSSSDPDSDSSN